MFHCNFRFSRYVLWVEAGVSNKNPKKIAGYFLETLENVKGTCNSVQRFGRVGLLNEYIEDNISFDFWS